MKFFEFGIFWNKLQFVNYLSNSTDCEFIVNDGVWKKELAGGYHTNCRGLKKLKDIVKIGFENFIES